MSYAPHRLGDILTEAGVITEAQLSEGLAHQKSHGGFLGQALVDLGYLTQDVLVSFLVKQCKIPHINLLDYHIDESILSLLPQELCLQYQFLPIDKLGKILTVAMVDPLDLAAVDQLRAACPDLKVKPILCEWQHFRQVAQDAFKTSAGSLEEVSAESFGLTGGPAAKPKPAATPPKASAATKPSAPAPPKPAGGPEKKAAPASSSSAGSEAKAQEPDGTQSTLAAIREAQAAQDARIAQLTEMTMQAAQAAQAAAKAALSAQENRQEEASRVAEKAEVAEHARRDLHRPPGERQRNQRQARALLGKPESDALEAIAGTGLRLRIDERILAALESEIPLSGYSFDSFIFGEGNSFTVKVAQAIAQSPGGEYNPLFLYGGVGLGKTHLINAIGNQIMDGNEEKRVGYIPSSRFGEKLTMALEEGERERFRESCCQWDVLILDDIQFWGGHIEAQEEFFHVFNTLHQENRQIIIAADKPPDHLGQLEKRLVSRFGSGIVASVQPPEWDTRLEILHRQVAQGQVEVPEEVVTLVATRVTTDIRKMTASLRKVIAFADLVGQEVQCDLANEILRHLGIEGNDS